MKELFVRLLFSLYLPLLLCCNTAQKGEGLSLKFSKKAPADSVLPFPIAQALVNDMAFFEQMVKMDSIQRPAYLDSLQKMGIIILLEKYQISLPVLKKTMNFYLSDLDTATYFFKQLDANKTP